MKNILFILMTAALVFTGCSMTDVSNSGSVYVALAPSDSSSRHLTQTTLDNTAEAVMGFIDVDALYNFRDMKDLKDFTGDGILFTDIPVGDYTFVAYLLNDEGQILSMGLKPVTIKAGKNLLDMEMGPGFDLKIRIPETPGIPDQEVLNLNLDEMSDDVDLSFDGTIIKIKLPKVFSRLAELDGSFSLKIKTISNIEMEFTKPDGSGFDPNHIAAEIAYPVPGNTTETQTSIIEFRELSQPEVKKFKIKLTELGQTGAPIGSSTYEIHLDF